MKRAIALLLITAPTMLFAAGYSLPNSALNVDGDEYATQPWVANFVGGAGAGIDTVLSNRVDVLDAKTNEWDGAVAWGEHAGLYDPLGTATTKVASLSNVLNAVAFDGEVDPDLAAYKDSSAFTNAVRLAQTNAPSGGGSGDVVAASYNQFTASNKFSNAVGTLITGYNKIPLSVVAGAGAAANEALYAYNPDNGGRCVKLATENYSVWADGLIRGSSVYSAGGATLVSDGGINAGSMAASSASTGYIFQNSDRYRTSILHNWGDNPNVISGSEVEIATGADPSSYPTSTFTPSYTYGWTTMNALGTASWAINVAQESFNLGTSYVTTYDLPVISIGPSSGGRYEVEFELDIECQSSSGSLIFGLAVYSAGTPPYYSSLLSDFAGNKVFTIIDFPSSYVAKHGAFKRVVNLSANSYIGIAYYASDTYTYTIHQARFRIKQH